jgi:hypothetical protein
MIHLMVPTTMSMLTMLQVSNLHYLHYLHYLHHVSGADDEDYKCGECGLVLEDEEGFEIHTRNYHSKVECAICHKSMAERKMEMHVWIHDGHSPFKQSPLKLKRRKRSKNKRRPG